MYLFFKFYHSLTILILYMILVQIICWDDYDNDHDHFDVCDYKDCDDNHNVIYAECSHETDFSAHELEAVRIYLQQRFAATYPSKPACRQLHVRKDIKCFTKREIYELISVFKALYANGVFDLLSLIHGSYWPSIHKFAEAVPWHRLHINRFEQEMKKINPNVSLPYWEYLSDFSSPEKSMVWHIFGHSGDRYNGYCVPDGPFAYEQVRFPQKGCLKRQWNTNGTMPVWEPPEWVTSITQVADNWPDYANLLGNSAHFKTHLSVGGFMGDMSDIFATNDPIFYLYHAHVADYAILKWQLSDDQNLVPSTYSQGSKFDWKSDLVLGADIENDYLTYYEDVSVKEMFQMGFGELCYIHDQLVRPILDIISNKPPKMPRNVVNLKKSLPEKVFQRYFPKFASKTATPFDYILPDVLKDSKSNYKSKNCNEMPMALPYYSTPNGRRFLYVMSTEANIDITPDILYAEQQYYKFMQILKRYRYCSPYV